MSERTGRARGKLLTTAEVGEALGIKPHTVRRICERNEMGHIKIGGPKRPTIMVPEGDLDEYIEKRRTPPQAATARGGRVPAGSPPPRPSGQDAPTTGPPPGRPRRRR